MAFLDTLKYFISHRHHFTFSGNDIDCNIVYSKSGVDFVKAFRMYDEKGVRSIITRHPTALAVVIKTKASLTFQIKQWAESRADGTLPLDLFSKRMAREYYKVPWLTDNIDIETELQLPAWVVNAVETQKNKFYK